MTAPVTIVERLREVALDQHGFVTSRQAKEEGVNPIELVKLAARGRLERAAHGVYRVPQVPGGRWENWALAVLWTGVAEACLSHETALAAWDISDINPDRIHVTIPKTKRLRRAGGEWYVIHRADLEPRQRTWFEQIPVTDVRTTIADCIDWGVPTYLIKQAFDRTDDTSLLLRDDRDELVRQPEARDYGR
jgi:predicted transcriptional regulator of viral defense system